MAALKTGELKKALISAGFEVYRTLGGRLLLADRVRDNLIMDSGVAAMAEPALGVRLVVRAQAHDFPGESEANLFERARRLGAASVARGYGESEALIVPIHDPGDRSRTLDVWYEVAFEKSVASLDELYPELKYALGVVKTAAPGARP
jgi:hypothetical protein